MKQKIRFKTLGWRIAGIILCSMFLMDISLAQERTISGIVTDIAGIGIPGANIAVKNSTTGTITDFDGNYSIKVPGNDAILLFFYIGFVKQEVIVGNQTTINITLKESETLLDEVVVVGYGIMKKKLSTGANFHVGEEEMSKMHSTRLEQALQGMSPGVQITANSGQPGEMLKVRIRGVGTVGKSDPLFVVDGVATGDIRYLSPSDIESVDVIKDAAAAAIYGTRAANGVILITTKKGKSGDMKISYDGYMGVQNTPKKMSLLGAPDYFMIMNEASTNVKKKPIYSQKIIDSVGKGTNWQDYLYNDNAPIQSHTVCVSGGSDKNIYSSSVSYLSQDGILGSPGRSKFERTTFRLNTENKLYKNVLKVGENLIYSHSNKKGIGVGNKYNSTVRTFANASPIFAAYDATTPDGYGLSWVATDEANPLAVLENSNISLLKDDKIMGNVYAEIEFVKGLKFRSDYGIDFSLTQLNQYTPAYYYNTIQQRATDQAEQSLDRNFTYNFENYLTYIHSFGKNNLNVLAGNTIRRFNRFYVDGRKEALIFSDFDHAILDNGTDQTTQFLSGTKLERALLSYYGRLNYNYDEKYLFSAIVRRDGSSQFGPDNRWGTFPSFAAGWVISQENFMKSVNALEFLKIRGGWGRNGNDQIGDFMYEATIQSTYRDYYFGAGDNKTVGSSPDKINNTKLKWETSEQSNIGIDAHFLKSFSLSFDWYKKITSDWLIIVPVLDMAGTNAPYANAGDVENKGYEIDLGYRKTIGELSFNINANIAFNKNEVTKIDNAEQIIHGESDILFHGHSECYRAEVGYPIGYFYGYRKLGIFQNAEEITNYINETTSKPIQPKAVPGDVKFADLNNDGVINTKDQEMIGDPNPDYTYGFSVNANYKGFDFSLVAGGVKGNQILYSPRIQERAYENYTTDILGRWTGEGTTNTLPRVTDGNEINANWKRVSSLYVKDGDYLKIRSINIGYDFSKSILKGKIAQLRLYFSALNIFTFTKYPGLDPEVGYGDYDANRYNNFSTGIDIGYFPTPKSYLMGLNVKF